MAAWMKGALALVALGAVVALALWLGSAEEGTKGTDAGSAVVAGKQDGARGGMSLPDGVATEQASPAPIAVENLALAPDAPEAPAHDGGAGLDAGPVTVLSGRVVDTGGRPVEGARIVFHPDAAPGVLRLGAEPGEEAPKPETRTDARGAFEFSVSVPGATDEEDDGLPDFLRGGSQLVAVHEGFATLITRPPPLEEGATDLGTFTMDPGTRVVGRVVDESGRAIAGATVTGQHLEDQGGRRGAPMARFFSGRLFSAYNRAVTGPDGRFLLTGLPAGKAELTAEAEGRQLGFKEGLELEAGGTHDVGDIALPAGALIAGFVVDPEGAPVAGASISVSSMARIVVRRMEDMPRQQIGREMRLRAETDEDGYFEMLGLGEGQYTVHVNAEGYARSSTENVPTGTRDLSVRLQPLGELIVTLQSSTDETPIRGALLTASALSGGPFGMGGGPLVVEESGSTAGEYTVKGAGPSGTELVVAASGFATLELEGVPVVDGGVERMTVQLVPESVIAGTVLDRDGKGIADARVRIEKYSPPSQEDFGGGFRMRREVSRRFGGGDETDLMDESTRTVTDETGRFELRGVPAGDWEITASAEDFVRSTPRVLTVDVGQSQEDVSISLDIGGAVVGHVTDADGEPVGDVTVIVRPRKTSGGGRESEITERLQAMIGDGGGADAPKRATTKPDGSYEVRSLQPGVYEVELASRRGGMRMGRAMVFISEGAEGSGNEDEIQLATVVAGEETLVDLVQAPMASLEGRVIAGGEPVEVALVSLNEKGAFMPFGGEQVETDEYGRYVFEGVEPGEYEVSTIVPGAALPEKQPVVLESGRTSEADLVFGGATLFGRVVDKQSGQGAPDVTIVLTPIKSASPGGEPQQEVAFEVVMVARGGGGGGGSGMSMQFGGGSQSKVKTDANGDFEVRFLKPGKYSIETLGGAFVNGQAGPIEVEDGESLDDVLIEVERGATISGLVISGETGQPLSGAPVSLSSEDTGEMTMTEGGRFTFEGLDAGEYTIDVMGSGFGGAPVASQAVSLDVGEYREVNLTTEG